MKAIALPFVALALAAAACTTSEPGDESPSPAKQAPEDDAPAEKSSDDKPQEPPSPGQKDAPPSDAGGVPEQPPGFVGTWEGYEIAKSLTVDIRLSLGPDGTGTMEVWIDAPKLKGTPDVTWNECSWRVVGDQETPTPNSPWVLQTSCANDEGGTIDETREVVALGEETLSVKAQLGGSSSLVTFTKK